MGLLVCRSLQFYPLGLVTKIKDTNIMKGAEPKMAEMSLSVWRVWELSIEMDIEKWGEWWGLGSSGWG
jgi:hypothetical protein